MFIQYTSEMIEQDENRLYAYVDDSTLPAVVRKPADRPAVAASINRDFARIQEWCNHWSMILNPSKTKALVFIRSWTVNPLHGDWVLSGVSIWASPNLHIFVVKFDSKLTLWVLYCFPCLSENWYFKVGETYIVDTSRLLCCYFEFVLQIFEYSSSVWGSAAECHLQLFERQVYSVARLGSDQSFLFRVPQE